MPRTPDDHHKAAEALLKTATEHANAEEVREAEGALAAAQVHATLAVAGRIEALQVEVRELVIHS